jgi:hemerythrin HHE cation binding domain-containing protein
VSSAATSVRGAMAGAVAAVMKRLPGDTDALALLERDHRRLEDLLKQGEGTTERSAQGRTKLLDTITSELTVHEMIEEKILYPALKAHPQGKDLALEGYQEHHVADLLIKELHDLAKDDERWGAKFKVLQENLEHHIQEEEGPMFRTARGLFTREELQALGALMMKMQSEAGARR